jgi:hypothetical protein
VNSVCICGWPLVIVLIEDSKRDDIPLRKQNDWTKGAAVVVQSATEPVEDRTSARAVAPGPVAPSRGGHL